MNVQDFISFIETTQQQEIQVLKNKANDYANQDIFSNFKKTADMIGLEPDKVFQMLLAIKLCRIVELTSGKEAKNESLDDTMLDMANYAKLYRGYLKSENK